MINKDKIQEKVEEILTLKVKLANAKNELKRIPDGYVYLILDYLTVLDSTCVNFDTAMEVLDSWMEDDMASNPCLYTNNPRAYEYTEELDLFNHVKFANISDLQNLYEGKK